MEREITEANYLVCLDHAVRIWEVSNGFAVPTGDTAAAQINEIARDLYLGIKSYGNTGINVS